jgi:hypothetical protein
MPFCGGEVGHVEADDHRQTELGELGDQKQVAPQIGRIDDREDGPWSRQILDVAEQHVDGHHFVR